MRKHIRGAASYLAGGGLGPFLVRATAQTGAVQVGGMLVTFFVGIQLARGLGLEGYGHYGIAMAAIALASVPGEYGIPKLVTREVAAASATTDRPRMFGVLRWADRISLALSALSFVAGLLLLLFFAVEGSSAVTAAVLVGLPVVPLVALARARGGALQGLHHIALGQFPFNLLRPLLLSILLFVLFWAWPDAGAPEAMALNVVTAAAAVVLGGIWLRSRLPGPPPKLVRTDRGWLAGCLRMALSDGMRVSSLQLAILLLGVLATSADAGLFRIAVSIAVLTGTPIALINRVVSPVLAKLHAEGDVRRMQQLCTRAAQAMAVAVLSIALPFLLFGEPLIGFLFGGDFTPAYTAVLILCAGQLVSASLGPNATLLMMTGHEARVTRAMFIAFGASVVLVVILAPVLASTGAAIAMASFLLVWNALAWFESRQLLGIETSLLTRKARSAPPKAS